MSLKTKINDDMKAAMRAKDVPRLGTVRLLLAAMKQKEVDERVELSDSDIVTIIDKMIKQRRDSIAQFEKGGRQDLADQEKFEIGVLQTYMPQALSEAEISCRSCCRGADERCPSHGRHGQGDGDPEAPTGGESRHEQGFRPG